MRTFSLVDVWRGSGASVAAGGRAPGIAISRRQTRATGVSAAYGLTGSVAVMDQALNRVTLLRSPSALNLSAASFDLGRDLATAQASFDRKTLFLLSRGVQPQRNPGDEPPKVTLLDGDASFKIKQTYTLNEPLDQLALDQQNEWAVVYGGSGLVVNENELLFVDLSKTGDDAVTFKTLRSLDKTRTA